MYVGYRRSPIRKFNKCGSIGVKWHLLMIPDGRKSTLLKNTVLRSEWMTVFVYSVAHFGCFL